MRKDDLPLRLDVAITRTGRQKGEVERELAQALAKSKRTIERIVAGDREPTDLELARIAELLGVSVDWLRDGDEVPRADPVDVRLDRLEALVTELATIARGTNAMVSELRDLARAERPGAGPEDRPRVPTPGEGPAGLR